MLSITFCKTLCSWVTWGLTKIRNHPDVCLFNKSNEAKADETIMFWYPCLSSPTSSSKKINTCSCLLPSFPDLLHFQTSFFLINEKTKRLPLIILTQRKTSMSPSPKLAECPSLLSFLTFSWWRGGRKVTLNEICASQSFLFLLYSNPIQPQRPKESVQHLFKGPPTQRSKPLPGSVLGVVRKELV